MGKNSLLKSTDKKKKTSKPVEQASKKSAKKDTPPAAEAETPQPVPETQPIGAAPAPPKTVQELLFEKFEPVTPQVAPQSIPEGKAEIPPAPPIFASTDPAEAEHMRSVLFARYSMEEVIASAVATPREASPDPVQTPPTFKEEAPPSPPPAEAAVPPADTTTADLEEPPAAAPIQAQAEAAPQPPPENAPEVKPALQPARPVTEEVKPVVTTVDAGTEADPVKRSILYAAAGFALIVLLLIGASYKNSGNYYLNEKDGALEISRGHFSPTGKGPLLVLHNTQAPQDLKAVYTREEVFPLAFNYYLDKADGLLETSGVPDYDAMRNYLQSARTYAISPAMETAVTTRLNSIERMPLLYKADVAISRGTPESLQNAIDYLRQSQRLTTDPRQAELITQKIAEVEARQAAIAAEAAAPPQAQ